MKIKYLLYLSMILTFCSCDQTHSLYFINKTNCMSKVKIVLDNKCNSYYLKKLAKGDSIIFNLKQNDSADIYFHIGNWSDEEIGRLVNCVQSIEVECGRIKKKYNSKSSLTRLFENKIDGFNNSNIVIEIE